MNTKQQNVLRSLLKKYQYKNVSNMVRMALGINYENFLQKTEPLYVVPRIASCYPEGEDRNCLNGKVYKEWLDMLVRKRWVDPINEYTDQYGAHIVLQAIYYLIDNNLWDVYEGRLALDAKEENYYDKLGDMPSAIAMMEENNKKEAEVSEFSADEATTSEAHQATNETKLPPQFKGKNIDDDLMKKAFEGDWWNNPDYAKDADEAVMLMQMSEALCQRLQQNIDRVSNYVITSADTDVLRQKIAKLQGDLDNEKDAHQKRLSELQVQVDDYKAKFDDAIATAKKASDYISNLKQKLSAKETEAQREYDELNAKYKKALDERDAADRDLEACKKLLDEEANKQQLPKKKVIPFSVLDAVPLLGKGVMTGLVPVLARYNIVVDYDK